MADYQKTSTQLIDSTGHLPTQNQVRTAKYASEMEHLRQIAASPVRSTERTAARQRLAAMAHVNSMRSIQDETGTFA